MKKQIRTTAFGLLLFCLLAATAAAAVRMLSVTVQKGALRATPMAFGRIVASLHYGDRVAVAEESGSWLKVREAVGGRQGWMHVSALTSKQVVLHPGDADVQAVASGEELALAGKGFNRQVEGAFKGRQRLDYAWVDRMESIVVPSIQMAKFLKQGGLAGEGGGDHGR